MNGHDERNDRPMRAAAAETDARAVRLARLERLAQRWLAAEATDAEERELREGVRTTGELPETLRGIRVLLEGLEALSAERRGACPLWGLNPTAEEPLREAAGPEPLKRRSAPSRRILRWGLSLAAAAVVGAGILLAAGWLRKPYCYIDGVAVYDREVAMQTTVYFDSFAALDTPNRLVDELIGAE